MFALRVADTGKRS